MYRASITKKILFLFGLLIGTHTGASLQIACAAETQALHGRWAVVTADPAVSGVGVLLHAERSRLDGVELVERDDIERVLNELQLTASGLVEPDKALRLGQLLSAEAILVVDVVAGSSSQARARLVETQTGVRMWDWIGPRQNPHEQAASITAELQRVREKLRVPPPQRQYVGVLGLQSEEPGTFLRPVAQTLTVLLEYDLQKVSNVVVLERQQLRRLTEERDLSSIELKLRGSTVLLDGALRRTDDNTGYVVTLRRLPLAGRDQDEVRLTTKTQQIREVRTELLRALAELVETRSPPPPAPVQEEAAALAEKRDSPWGTYDRVALGEAALALDPSDRNVRALISILDGVARAYNNAARSRGREEKEVRDEDLRLALETARRLHELDLTWLRAKLAANSHDSSLVYPRQAFLPDIEVPNDGEPDENRRLRAEVDRLRLEKHRLLSDLFRGRAREIGLLIERIRLAAYFADTPEMFCQTLEQAATETDALFRRYGFAAQGEQNDLLEALLDAVQESQGGRLGWWPDRQKQWPLDKLVPLCHRLARHPNPAIRLAGLYGAILSPDEDGVGAAKEAIARVHQLPNDHLSQMYGRQVLIRAESRLRRAGSTAQDLDNLFQRRSPQLVQSAPRGTWDEYSVKEIPLPKPDGYGQALAAAIDRSADARRRNEELILVFRQSDKKAMVARASILGDGLTKLAEIPYDMPLPGRPWATVVFSPNAIFISSRAPELSMLTKNGLKTFGPADGAPGDSISTMAWLDGALYLSYGGALAKFDPETEHFALVASRTLLQPRNPLDGGAFYSISSLLAAPEQHCLLAAVQSYAVDERAGVWKYTPATGSFERVVAVRRGGSISNLRWNGKKAFCLTSPTQTFSDDPRLTYRNLSWIEIDLQENQFSRLEEYPVYELRPTDVGNFLRVGDHIISAGGRLFTPGGGESAYPVRAWWQMLEPYGSGFLTANFSGDVQKMWHFERKRDPEIVTAPAGAQAGGTATPEGVPILPVEIDQGCAVRLVNEDAIELSNSQDLVAKGRPITVEFWVRLASEKGGHTLLSNLVVGAERRGLMIQCTPRSTTDYLIGLHVLNTSVFMPVPLQVGTWHHFAICHDGRDRTQLFLDGHPVIAFPAGAPGSPDSPLNLRIGSPEHLAARAAPGFNGDLRAFRISSTCRYLYSFQPPLSFDKDLHTEVLLDFSAESGPTIQDLSGHNRDGRLMGGEWILLDAAAARK